MSSSGLTRVETEIACHMAVPWTQAGAPSIQGWGREKDQLSQETVFLTDTLGLGGRAWVHRPRRVRQGRFGIEKSLGI